MGELLKICKLDGGIVWALYCHLVQFLVKKIAAVCYVLRGLCIEIVGGH